MTKILIIRFRRIGDSVISSTLCSSLKKSVPNAEIHYVLNENICPLYKDHPDIDKLIGFSQEDMSSTIKYFKKIYTIMKLNKYDIIIDTRSTIKTLPFSIFSLKTPFRIGRKKWYNKIIQNYRVYNNYDGTRDNAQMTLALLDPLKIKYQIIKDSNFKLYYNVNELEKYKKYMKECGINFNKPIIICGVVARQQHKEWNKDKMITVLNRIIGKYDAQLIFNYAGNIEKESAVEIATLIGDDCHIFTNIEANSLPDLICLLANSSFYFGIEGGTRHISQALEIPSFAIYPPGIDKHNWLPNQSSKYQGIELKDIINETTSTRDLSFEEQYDLFDIENVWQGLDNMLEEYINLQ